MAQTKKEKSMKLYFFTIENDDIQELFDDDQNDEEPMEEDVPYDDQFNEVESTSEEDDDETDEPKVCYKISS